MFLLKVGRWFFEVFMSFRFRLCSCLKRLQVVSERNETLSKTLKDIFQSLLEDYRKYTRIYNGMHYFTRYQLRSESAMQIFIYRVKVPFVT